MKKQHYSIIFLSFMIGMTVYGVPKRKLSLETYPEYIRLKKEVENLKSFRYAWHGVKTVVIPLVGTQLVVIAPQLWPVAESGWLFMNKKIDFMNEKEDEAKKIKLTHELEAADNAYREEINKAVPLLTNHIRVGLLGATLGAAGGEAYRRYRVGKINRALAYYKTGYTFMKLPIDEAIMVLAAYQKQIYIIRKLQPFMAHFINQSGVWEALTHLYFGVVTPENIVKLKEYME